MTFDLAQMIAALQDRTMSWVGDGSQPDPLCTQAAAEIIRLTARVERLEGALMDIRSHYTHDQSAFAGVVARAALSTHTEEPKT